MHILQVISYFYPSWSYGGPGKLVYDLSAELVKRKNTVSVLSTDVYDALRRRQTRDNQAIVTSSRLKTYFFPNISNRLAYKTKVFLPLFNIITLIKEIRSANVVHIHEFFTPLTVIVSHLSMLLKKPYILSAHGTLDHFHISHRKQIKDIFMKLVGFRILQNSSLLIAATYEEIGEYKKLGVPRRKIKLVTNGIKLDEYKKIPAKGFFRKKYQIGTHEKLLVFLGRINKLKGLDMLINSFILLLKSIKARLIIAGSDDGYLSELKKILKEYNIYEKVVFPGILTGINKLKTYADCDLFVYPSPAEGFSIAILEAGACRLPLLITDGCKFPEVKNYKAGMIVPFQVNSYYQAMKKILINDGLREQFALNARKLVFDKYSIEFMGKNIETAYLESITSYGKH